jgi:hypothetical protein
MNTTSIEFTKRTEEKTTFVLDRTIYLRSNWGTLYMVSPTMTLHLINIYDHGTGQPTSSLMQVKTAKDAAVEPLSKWLNGTEKMEEMPAEEFWALWYKGVGLVCKANELYANHIGADVEMVTLKIQEHEQ